MADGRLSGKQHKRSDKFNQNKHFWGHRAALKIHPVTIRPKIFIGVVNADVASASWKVIGFLLT
jgi:hypothetical protein